MSPARAWLISHHPVAAIEPYPFRSHRTCAEWSDDRPETVVQFLDHSAALVSKGPRDHDA